MCSTRGARSGQTGFWMRSYLDALRETNQHVLHECDEREPKSRRSSSASSGVRGGVLIRFSTVRDQYVMHHFGHFDAAAFADDPVYGGHSEGYRQTPLVDHAAGSVHPGLSIAEVAPGGTIAPHVHSYEESFYILSGEAILGIGDHAYRVGAGDFGALKVGIVHGWRAAGSTPVRWLQMAAPQPKPPGRERDTFFLK